MLPVSATMRSRSKTYSLSCATDRSAYFTAPMPICRAMVARMASSRSGRVSSMTARAFSTASSSSAMSRNGAARARLEDLAVLAEHVADLHVDGHDVVGQPAGLAGRLCAAHVCF